MSKKIRLGLNIDHIATLRNARGGIHPSPLRAALLAQEAGVDGITLHLREDRRHIHDEDVIDIKSRVNLPLNFEMAAADEMLNIAQRIKPNACCIVPEKREELTTEGGLDVVGQIKRLEQIVPELQKQGARVSLFIDPNVRQVEAAQACGADIVEIHSGEYCHALTDDARAIELKHIIEAAARAEKNGLEVHAGHGLTYDLVPPIAAITQIVELNIGHFIIGEAIFLGLAGAISRMRHLMDEARV